MFFFSSRRRHTRFDCDWSSDVCSSDLGRTSHKDQSGTAVPGNTQLAGGLASLVWNVPMPAPMFKPYVLAGAGVYHVKVSTSLGDASETKLAYGGGAGGSFGAGPARFFVEGRYLRVQESGGAVALSPLTAWGAFGPEQVSAEPNPARPPAPPAPPGSFLLGGHSRHLRIFRAFRHL